MRGLDPRIYPYGRLGGPGALQGVGPRLKAGDDDKGEGTAQ